MCALCFVCVCFWSPHSQGEYAAGSGDTQYGAARGGRIPGAVWFWWEDLFRDGNLKPAAAILQELQEPQGEERPMTPVAAATITQTEAHPDAAPLTSCHAIPRRVSRAVIMRRNPNYEFKGTPENMPPVIREAPPTAAGKADDDWEQVETTKEAPSMWEMVTGAAAEPEQEQE